MQLSENLLNKYKKLQSIFLEMENVLVAYSGGVDSTLLLKVGADTLGEKCIGIIGKAPSLANEEYNRAIEIANEINANLKTIDTHEMENQLYVTNDIDRCYFCKSELFNQLNHVAKKLNVKYIIEGSNVDDLSDYRPGKKAAKENCIRSPFVESELSKPEIREISKYLGLKTWNQPSQPCLSSRIAYGVKIEENKLDKIGKAELFLKESGFKIVRVRLHNDHVSVEVGQDELEKLFTNKIQNRIVAEFKKIGIDNIKFDPEGYKSGKLNQLAKVNE